MITIPEEVLNDVFSRFILPEANTNSDPIRLCFAVEVRDLLIAITVSVYTLQQIVKNMSIVKNAIIKQYYFYNKNFL